MFYHSTFSDGKVTLDECDLGKKTLFIFPSKKVCLLMLYCLVYLAFPYQRAYTLQLTIQLV